MEAHLHQLPLLDIGEPNLGQTTSAKPIHDRFSHDNVCSDESRRHLESLFAPLIAETSRFSRKTVSFQANKVTALHNWIHYREGFSSQLIAQLMDELGVTEEDTVLDPFAGSCTTLLQAMQRNITAIGIELLPNCHLAWAAKSNVYQYDILELGALKKMLSTTQPAKINQAFPHISITESAFPAATEQDIVNYAYWIQAQDVSEKSKTLLQALLMSILESVSYTRKDGQYLRWDTRSTKKIERNRKRIAQGKKPFKGIDKGVLPTVRDALVGKLGTVIRDIEQLQNSDAPTGKEQTLLKENTLFALPSMDVNSVNFVITSPPYANRYDYTRTYALELAFLEIGDDIFGLRQGLLSCTVENKPKFAELKAHYQTLGIADRFDVIENIIATDPTLREIKLALAKRSERGEINNKGVLSMIEQYFAELTFVFAELYRVCAPGGQVVFVNDNVRYAGEVIPVDTISTHLAQTVGFEPRAIYVIPQRKGNSSQQMKRFGRRELRKSITVWQKPE